VVKLFRNIDPLAAYGAVLATVLGILQWKAYRKDNAAVVLQRRSNMAPIAHAAEYRRMMTIITATNVGRRPVTITGFAARLLHGQRHTDWVLPDVRPRLPHEITEGHFVSAYLNEQGTDFSIVEHWYAWDSTGKHYRLNHAPFGRRLKSKVARWLSSKRTSR
jgi:hypothetical protein